MSDIPCEHREVSSPRVSKYNVYIQGDLKHSHFQVLTVHDLGCNHKSWFNFLDHESMAGLRERVSFIHVDVPGQEDGATDLPAESPKWRMIICGSNTIVRSGKESGHSNKRNLQLLNQTNYFNLTATRFGPRKPYNFPTMQSLGEDLVCVLDQLEVKNVVGLGEGAGANILARFAMSHPKRVLGVCLIHCTGTTAGFMESLKDKVMGWKLNHIGMNPTAEAYLVLHRFGSFEKAENKEELNKVLQTFQESLRSKINPLNLNRFVQSFMKRSNIADNIQKLTCPVLMVTGDKASFNHTVHHLYSYMQSKIDKKNVELLEVEGVANVIEERPRKLAESFVYFCQGMGLVGGLPMPRMSRTSSIDGVPENRGLRNRSMSMEEADQPKGVYSTSPTRTSHMKDATTSDIQVKVDNE